MVRAHHRGRRQRRHPAAPAALQRRPANCRARRSTTSTPSSPNASAKPTNSTPSGAVPADGRGSAPHPAPGGRRADVVEAVLPLQRPAMARRRSRPTAAAAGAQARPQPQLGAPQQRRHHLDAGQVGVPVVRGLGSRLPLRRARGHRRRVRQGATRAARPRVVPASERPDSRLRVGLRRRQPARLRLGGVARLRDRPQATRHAATPRSSSASSTSCCSTSPGG